MNRLNLIGIKVIEPALNYFEIYVDAIAWPPW